MRCAPCGHPMVVVTEEESAIIVASDSFSHTWESPKDLAGTYHLRASEDLADIEGVSRFCAIRLSEKEHCQCGKAVPP